MALQRDGVLIPDGDPPDASRHRDTPPGSKAGDAIRGKRGGHREKPNSHPSLGRKSPKVGCWPDRQRGLQGLGPESGDILIHGGREISDRHRASPATDDDDLEHYLCNSSSFRLRPIDVGPKVVPRHA